PDASVGTVPEPCRVFGHPWMVRRCLEGQIDRHVDAPFACISDEGAKVVDRAEFRMDRGVPSRGTADGPGAPRIPGAGTGGAVPALSCRHPDRVDRRKIEDIEAELFDIVEPPSNVGQGAVACGIVRSRSGEQLVPGT